MRPLASPAQTAWLGPAPGPGRPARPALPAVASSARMQPSRRRYRPPSHRVPTAAASPSSGGETTTSTSASPSSSSSSTHLHRLDAADTAPGYGPRGVLLVGLSAADAASVAAWFGAMEPGFAISHCSGGPMLEGSVRAAVFGQKGGDGEPGGDDLPPPSSFAVFPFSARPADVKLPRLALFAGMAPQEMVAIAENWAVFTEGMAAPVLVTLLPGMLPRPLGEVILEATRAAASAAAVGGRGGDGPDADRMDGAALKAAVRAKVEERRAGKGRQGPLIRLPGEGGGEDERVVVVGGSAKDGRPPSVEEIKAAVQRVASSSGGPGRRAGKKGAGPGRGFGAAAAAAAAAPPKE